MYRVCCHGHLQGEDSDRGVLPTVTNHPVAFDVEVDRVRGHTWQVEVDHELVTGPVRIHRDMGTGSGT